MELGSPQGQDLFSGPGEMAALVRAKDWSRTPLGPVQSWPQSLLTVVNLILDAHYPMLVLWGPEFVQIYNDAYRPVLGATKHPAALGQRARECWPEIWDMIGPMFERALTRAEATWNDDFLFVLDRNGYLEETYFTFCYSAIRDESRRPGGVLVTCVETTERVLGERRLRTLRELAAQAAQAQTAEEACRTASRTLAANPHDIPFALLYLLEGDSPEARRARLVGTSGLEPGRPASPAAVDLADDAPWPFAAVARTGEAAVVPDVATRLGHLPGSPWPEAPTHALVLPIPRPGRVEPTGLLVAGISPRRTLDDDYRGFLDLVAGHVGTAVANARAHEAERQRAEALAEIDRAKTAFFSNVSHEFRTPLTLLLGPVEDALADRGCPLPEAQRERLDIAHRNGLRLLRLVNSLLDFSRIEAGRVQALYAPTDLAALTAELASVFRSAAERAGLRLIVDCPPLPEPIYVDREMWEKIVLNLLSNALKFTFEGEIAVSLRVAGDTAQLRVRDTGTGIPPAEIPRLFERFHRIRDARARTHEGTGIGLALVQELARLHGGTVDVESVVGAGSTFAVSIPRGTAHLPPDRVGTAAARAAPRAAAASYVEEALRWLPDEGVGVGEDGGVGLREAAPAVAVDASVSSPTPSPRLPTPPRARVLLADDNADMRAYLARLLGEEWAVEAVPDGEAALARATADPPDLVLADVMMPRLDGFGLLRALRANPTTGRIPIILLSARAGQEATVEGLESGADDYLVKPFAAHELLARVRTHLKLAQLREEATRREQAARAAVEVERARLRSVFQQAPAFLAILRGPAHVFEFANPSYLEVVGRAHLDDLIGKAVREALPEVVGQGYVELLDQVYATGVPFVGTEMPVRLDRRGDGTLDEVFVNFVYQPLRDGAGEIEGIIALGFEVTEPVRARRRIEALATENARLASEAQDLARARAAERDWFRQALDVLPEGIAIADVAGQVTLLNAAAESIGAKRMRPRSRLDEVVGVWHADGTRCRPDEMPLVRSVATGEIVRGESLLIESGSGDRRVPVLISSAPLRDSRGTIAGAVAVFQDISALKEADRQKDEFLGGLSHDLKLPLTAIKAQAQLLQRLVSRPEQPAPERLAQLAETIDGAATRMAGMIDEVLDTTRLQLGRPLTLDPRPVDLVALARRVAAEAQKTTDAHRLRVEAATPELVGHWDERRLERVIANLVVNAVKYSPDGGDVTIEVGREADARGARAVLLVRDAGMGIPAFDLPHIFERFRRGGNVGEIRGTGIGLANARQIIEQHGGTIAVASREGQGSTFTVRLPIR